MNRLLLEEVNKLSEALFLRNINEVKSEVGLDCTNVKSIKDNFIEFCNKKELNFVADWKIAWEIFLIYSHNIIFISKTGVVEDFSLDSFVRTYTSVRKKLKKEYFYEALEETSYIDWVCDFLDENIYYYDDIALI